MTIMVRGSIFIVVVFCLSAAATKPAAALVLDWSSASWTPGTLSNSYNVDPNSPGNDITVSFGADTGSAQVDPASGLQTPAITSSMQGGGAPNATSLELATAMIPPNKITVTVTFSAQYTRGVEGILFTLFDIDQGDKQDLVDNIFATDINGVKHAAVISNVGFAVKLSGAGFAQKLSGIADSPDTGSASGVGNATISFGSSPIRSFTFTFDGTPGGPKLQTIGISNITFSPVPEINPAVISTGLCLIGGIALSRRRNRRRTSG